MLFCKNRILYALFNWICYLTYLNFYSGGMTRPQPPTCCCCQRSKGANLSACAPSRQPVRTPALHYTREYRSVMGPQLPKGFAPFLVFTTACPVCVLHKYCFPVSGLVVDLCCLSFFLLMFSFRLGTPFTSARMKML